MAPKTEPTDRARTRVLIGMVPRASGDGTKAIGLYATTRGNNSPAFGVFAISRRSRAFGALVAYGGTRAISGVVAVADQGLALGGFAAIGDLGIGGLYGFGDTGVGGLVGNGKKLGIGLLAGLADAPYEGAGFGGLLGDGDRYGMGGLIGVSRHGTGVGAVRGQGDLGGFGMTNLVYPSTNRR